MPVDDERLERALRDAAPPIASAGAFERVASKRARRRTMRTARLGALASVAAVVVVASVLLVARDEDPARVTAPAATVPGATTLSLTPPDDRYDYLRGPLTMSGDLVSVAAYKGDGAGGFDFPSSYIVRFDPATLEVVDEVELRAEILSVADGADGVRWAVTRNKDPDGPVPAGHFLKRVDPNGTVHSFDLPAGTDVTGDVTVIGPNVLVPTRAGMLSFDAQGTPRDGDVVVRLPILADIDVPPGFVAEETRSAGDRTWVTGTRNGARAVVLLDGTTVVDTIILPGRDVSFVWVDDDTVLATTDGRLVRLDVQH